MSGAFPYFSRRPGRWPAIAVLSLLPWLPPSIAAAAPLIFPCHQARIIALLEPYGTTRDIIPGWRFSSLSISDRIEIGVRRGAADQIDVVLHHPGWTGEAAYQTAHFRIAVRGGPTVPSADVTAVGTAVAATIAKNDRRSVWYESGPTPFPIDQPPPCLSSRYLALSGALLMAIAAVAVHGWWFARAKEAALKQPLPHPRPLEWGALAGMMAIAAVVFLGSSALRYARFGVRNVDLGMYAHAFWHALHGNGLFNSPEGMDHLSSHASPGLYLLLPLYALAPHPLTLLSLNSLALISGAIPAYLIARRRLGVLASLLCAALYLVNPALSALNYEVHEISFAVPLFLWTLLFLQCRRAGLMLLTLLLAVLWKENVGVSAIFLGAYALVVQRRVHVGVGVMLLGLLVVVAGIHLVVPYFGGSHANKTMIRYAALADDWSGLLLSPLRRPAAFFGTVFSGATAEYLMRVLSPFVFLPLLSPLDLFVAIPPLAENILAGDGSMRSGQHHYEALILPVFYVAFVAGLARLCARASVWGGPAVAGRGALLLLSALLVANPLLHHAAGRGLLRDIDGDPARGEIEALLARIPPGAAVISPQHIQPHVSDRVVSAYFNGVGDLAGDPPVFEWAVVPSSVSALPATYELVSEGVSYSLYRRGRRATHASPLHEGAS